MRASVPSSAIVGAAVGCGGTLALVIAAADALGATQAQTASSVTALCLVIAAQSLLLSWRTRMPVITAWSTPGLALVAAAQGYGVPDAVGAYIVAALMLIATGLARPVTRQVERIPIAVSSGMLAGILFTFAAGAARAAGTDPWLVLPLAALFFVARLLNPALSVLAVLVGGVAYSWGLGRIPEFPAPEVSTLVLTAPSFSLGGVFGLAVPLYLVTMASQNLAGLAVLKAAGYEPPAGQAITVTGLFSLLSAPFGAVTTNLSAMAAAMCTGPDTHPDSSERWKVGPFYAAAYVVFAIFGASMVALFAVLPPALVLLVAGLGLLGSLANAMFIAIANPAHRIAATVTFAVTASGVSAFGVGAAFWGLLAGLAVLALDAGKKSLLRQ